MMPASVVIIGPPEIHASRISVGIPVIIRIGIAVIGGIGVII
jgi:hypothetical protein